MIEFVAVSILAKAYVYNYLHVWMNHHALHYHLIHAFFCCPLPRLTLPPPWPRLLAKLVQCISRWPPLPSSEWEDSASLPNPEASSLLLSARAMWEEVGLLEPWVDAHTIKLKQGFLSTLFDLVETDLYSLHYYIYCLTYLKVEYHSLHC